MKATVNYGKTPVEIEAENLVVSSPQEVEKRNEIEVLTESLDNPVDSDPFSSFIEDEFLLVVNDAQRPTPTSKVLDVLLPYAIPTEIVVATGSHAPPDKEGLTYIFGDHLSRLTNKIYIHNATENPHTYYGTTSQGVKIYFDEILKKYQKVVVIGSVEPHYFAGLTGGRKSFLPGLSAYETIEQNHEFALSKKAKNLALKGNPVHECMVEAAHMIKNDVFFINLVLDKDRSIYACSSGNMFKSFDKAAEWSQEVYCVPTDMYDIVLAAASYPLDVNLYQAQKAIENGKLALNDGGILILVAQCRDGIGPDKFYQLLKQSKTPDDALEILKKGYKLGYHKAAKIAELAKRAEIWAVTDLEFDKLKNAYMKPYTSIQKAIDDAIKIKGANILVLPEASMTVPVSEESLP
jgi:nickel-dependent lactate racemase